MNSSRIAEVIKMSSSFSEGLATFNSNKIDESIPYFTEHLESYPEDYQALMWRGRAYGLTKNHSEAKADFWKASQLASDWKRNLALSLFEIVNGNSTKCKQLLEGLVKEYPVCSEAWYNLGDFYYSVESKVNISLEKLQMAIFLAKKNSETGQPWYTWCNQTIGDIFYYEKLNIPFARLFYECAVSCPTFTTGYLGLSRCDVILKKMDSAKLYFKAAKELNPELVKWETFDEFSVVVKGNYESKLASLVNNVHLEAPRY